jgi:hypothetical protein
MIAPILAAKRSDIAAIVLLAAPGNNTPEVLVEQNEAFLTSNGLPEDYVTSYVNLYSSIIRLMKNNPDKQRAKAEVTAEVENWIKKTPASIVAATTNIKNDQQKASFIEAMVGTFGTPWFQYFLNYEPQKFLENITCKVLALNGEKDIQILAKSNLAGIETALKKSKSRGYKVKEYEGLNHLFQKCNTCSIKEYGELEETISMDVLKDITAWLKIEM